MGPAQPAKSAASSSSLSAPAVIMSAPSATIEQLPANIPWLEPNGANWAIFQMRFKDTMKVTQQWGYFTSLKPCPKIQDLAAPTDDELNGIEQWEHDNSVTCSLLSQCLPNTTIMCLSSCCHARLGAVVLVQHSSCLLCVLCTEDQVC